MNSIGRDKISTSNEVVVKRQGNNVVKQQGTLQMPDSVRQGTLQMPDSVRQGTKNSLEQRVNILKNDIEYIIKLNKTQISNEERKENVNLKQKKMSELKKLSEDLKSIYKKEKLEQSKRNEILSIQKTMDNLDFRAAKKKNNSEAMDNAKKSKEQRELLRKSYLEAQEIEKKYLEKDSKILPGNLFLHEDIIKKYGLCPFINENEMNENGSEIEKKRLEWLESKDDKGECYYNLYKDFYENTIINSLLKEKQKIEDSIEDFIKKSLSPSQYELYNDSISFLQEYIKCAIKSKRIKERYKNFINNMSILYMETSFPLHNYISLKYNIHIIINDISKGVKILDKQEKMVKILSIEEFEKLIDEFDKINKSCEQKSKFNMNIIKNLNSNLYYYLTDNEEFLKKFSMINIVDKKQNAITQEGKYFKRWILLSNDEKLERFYSFSEYFINKFVSETENNLVEKLYNLLKNDFVEKRIVYRDYKWNVQSGIIENIKILRYDKDKKDFILKYTTPKKKEASKKVSTKTIITKNIEKIINEELLYFIVKKLKSENNETNNESNKETNNETNNEANKEANNEATENYVKNKEEFFDNIKEKLSVKKINKTDKEIINKTYDNIYEIIKNNKLN